MRGVGDAGKEAFLAVLNWRLLPQPDPQPHSFIHSQYLFGCQANTSTPYVQWLSTNSYTREVFALLCECISMFICLPMVEPMTRCTAPLIAQCIKYQP